MFMRSTVQSWSKNQRKLCLEFVSFYTSLVIRNISRIVPREYIQRPVKRAIMWFGRISKGKRLEKNCKDFNPQEATVSTIEFYYAILTKFSFKFLRDRHPKLGVLVKIDSHLHLNLFYSLSTKRSGRDGGEIDCRQQGTMENWLPQQWIMTGP